MQTRMQAEGDRGFAIRSIGKAIASHAYRVQRISCFLCPGRRSPGEELSAARHGALPHIYCSEEIGDAAPAEIYPSTCPSRSCGVVDLVDRMRRRRRHAEHAHREKKENGKKRKEKREKQCGRLYFLKHDSRRYPQTRDNIARLSASTTAKLDSKALAPRLIMDNEE